MAWFLSLQEEAEYTDENGLTKYKTLLDILDIWWLFKTESYSNIKEPFKRFNNHTIHFLGGGAIYSYLLLIINPRSCVVFVSSMKA